MPMPASIIDFVPKKLFSFIRHPSGEAYAVVQRFVFVGSCWQQAFGSVSFLNMGFQSDAPLIPQQPS
jgi:hypothetical protein